MGQGQIRAFNINELYPYEFEYDEIEECPMCHFGIQPRVINAFYVDEEQSDPCAHLYITFYCPKCHRGFLTDYLQKFWGSRYQYAHAYTQAPVTPNYEKFTPQICSLSPTFVSTYAQAQQAEAGGLSEIYGIGYRKALEYLVKDYLCHVDPEHEEEIKKELLGHSIKRIDNPKIKTLAERSTWIGNDETHYVRKHVDLNVEDMKRFIIAMVRYVDSELAFEDASAIERK